MNPYDIDKIPMLVCLFYVYIYCCTIFDRLGYRRRRIAKNSSATASASNEGCGKWAISMDNILALLLLLSFSASPPLCSNNRQVTDILVLACQHILSFY